MERFNKLSRGMQLMLAGSVLFLISTFFPWQDFLKAAEKAAKEAGVPLEDFDIPSGLDTTWNAWHGFFGVVMGLLTIVLIAWLVARLAAVDLPVPVSLTGAVLAFLIVACALIKNLSDDWSTLWSYLGVGLAALIAVGAWMQIQEAGGVDNLKSEIPGMPASGTTASAPPPPPAAEAAAPPPPPAAEAAPSAPGTPPAPPMSEDAAPEAAASEPDANTGTPSTERET